MTRFTIASFNVKNLIGPDQEYYEYESYTPEEYAWKQDWLADQLLTMDADIVGFQEIFDEAPLRAVIDEADARGRAANAATVPDNSKRYARKAIFRKLAYTPYADATLVFAPNINDGAPGQRRPGLALLTRYPLAGPGDIIQEVPGFDDAPQRPGEDGKTFRLSRPILKQPLQIGDQVITVFNIHLKSKLGEFHRPADADFAPEQDLLAYDPVGRAMGSLRAAQRRMTEAWVLRREIVAELQTGRAVIVLGDFNDAENAVSSEIISGEAPFKNYAWMRRHDARHRSDRYSDAENTQIRTAIEAVRLHSAERLFVRKSLRDMVYTTAFGGVFESIDQILLSHHFHPDNPDRLGDMHYLSVFNDHLTDGSHPEAPYNKLASDHGQIMAHLSLREKDSP